MDKAEKVFSKLAQYSPRFEVAADQQMQQLHQGIDAYNKRVKKETAKRTGQGAAAGGAAGAAGTGIYSLLKGKGGKKALTQALKGGGIGAGIAGAGAAAYLLPKAIRSYVNRDEERVLGQALDDRQDMARVNRIRSMFRNYAAQVEDNDTSKSDKRYV